MKIEIWFDVACPFCYIGFNHLEQALAQYAGVTPEMILRSFELEPDIVSNSGDTPHLAVIRTFHQSPLRAQQTLEAVVQVAGEAGLLIDFDKVIITNTFNAHRLIHFAVTLAKGTEMKDRLFKAYFAEGRHLGNKTVLTEIATELGIDAEMFLYSDLYSAEVRKDEHESQYLGVRSIPFFLFDGKYSISGAQPVQTFLGVLNKLQAKN